MAKEAPKLCKDCKFFDHSNTELPAICTHENTADADLVHGAPQTCVDMRWQRCGPEAKWFEPKDNPEA